MRKEFWRGVIMLSLLILGCALFLKNKELLVYTFSLIAVGIFITVFYFSKFKKFYDEIENTNYSTFQSLLELDYSLKHFSELYLNYYIAFVPIYLCEIMIISQFRQIETSFLSFLISWILLLIIPALSVSFSAKWYFNKYYGKHIAQVTTLLNEIKHPYEDFDTKFEYKTYWYDKTEDFFTQKIGKFGKTLNLLLWILGSIIILFVAGFVTGYLVGYFIG